MLLRAATRVPLGTAVEGPATRSIGDPLVRRRRTSCRGSGMHHGGGPGRWQSSLVVPPPLRPFRVLSLGGGWTPSPC